MSKNPKNEGSIQETMLIWTKEIEMDSDMKVEQTPIKTHYIR